MTCGGRQDEDAPVTQLEQSRSHAQGLPPGRLGEAPPGPTTAELKHDIDSGRTGDKVQLVDPGLAPLGTDDEAAGRPPTPHRVALARYHEVVGRWRRSPFTNSGSRPEGGWALPFFIGFIVLVGVVLAVALVAVAPRPL
jgi:hypothetical protein